MIHLKDYYHPFSFGMSLTLISVLFYLDSLGFWVRREWLKATSSEFRTMDVLLGLGHFVFLWFVLGFFIAPTQIAIAFSLVCTGIPLQYYSFKKKALKQLVTLDLLSPAIVFLIVARFLNLAFVKSSLPPYYSDEMAYHFISASALTKIDTWHFEGDLYGMLPRLLDTFYLLGFSLTKTQVIGRAVHFIILLSTFIMSFRILKKRLGIYTAFLFVFGFFSIPQNIVFYATLGFVDVASFCFILLGVIFGFFFSLEKDMDLLILSAFSWSMALGIKYTGLTCFVVFLFVLAATILTRFSQFKSLFTFSVFKRLLTVSTFCGGYWYIKNLVLTGNPIFPFIFPCYRWTEACQTGSSFFGTWTTPISWANRYLIGEQLFQTQHSYLYLIGLGLFATWIPQLKTARFFSFAVLLLVAGELLILKQTSGFLMRYHQHLQLLLLLLIAVPLGSLIQIIPWRLAQIVVLLAICKPLFSTYRVEIRNANLSQMTKSEADYAYGKTDIFSFVESHFPGSISIVRWCDNPPGGKAVDLLRIDPDTIWFTDATYYKQFFTNCHDGPTPFNGQTTISEITERAKREKMSFYLWSVNACTDPDRITKKIPEEKDWQLQMARVNNFLVCHSKKVLPDNIYYFDYRTL